MQEVEAGVAKLLGWVQSSEVLYLVLKIGTFYLQVVKGVNDAPGVVFC
jgi:hypothetical protein